MNIFEFVKKSWHYDLLADGGMRVKQVLPVCSPKAIQRRTSAAIFTVHAPCVWEAKIVLRYLFRPLSVSLSSVSDLYVLFYVIFNLSLLQSCWKCMKWKSVILIEKKLDKINRYFCVFESWVMSHNR